MIFGVTPAARSGFRNEARGSLIEHEFDGLADLWAPFVRGWYREAAQTVGADTPRRTRVVTVTTGEAKEAAFAFCVLAHRLIVPPNGRFLRHRPERSERCLNYENCTKAMARCQRAKVCPKGLSVKTMLHDR